MAWRSAGDFLSVTGFKGLPQLSGKNYHRMPERKTPWKKDLVNKVENVFSGFVLLFYSGND